MHNAQALSLARGLLWLAGERVIAGDAARQLAAVRVVPARTAGDDVAPSSVPARRVSRHRATTAPSWAVALATAHVRFALLDIPPETLAETVTRLAAVPRPPDRGVPLGLVIDRAIDDATVQLLARLRLQCWIRLPAASPFHASDEDGARQVFANALEVWQCVRTAARRHPEVRIGVLLPPPRPHTDRPVLAGLDYWRRTRDLAAVAWEGIHDQERGHRLARAAQLLFDHGARGTTAVHESHRRDGLRPSDLAFDASGHVDANQQAAVVRALRAYWPIDVNTAPETVLRRVPGIGDRGARRLIVARAQGVVRPSYDLPGLGIDVHAARPWLQMQLGSSAPSLPSMGDAMRTTALTAEDEANVVA